MTLVTVRGMFRASSSGQKLDAEFDMVADRLIDLEDGTLLDSTLSADLEEQHITVEVTVASDATVEEAEQVGFGYIDQAIHETVGLKGVRNTGRQAELVSA